MQAERSEEQPGEVCGGVGEGAGVKNRVGLYAVYIAERSRG